MIESTIIEIAFALFLCMLLGSIFTKYKQSSVVGYLLGGMLLGPAVLNIVNNSESISLFSEIGILLLLFYIGLELDSKKFKAGGFIAFMMEPIRMLICFGFGYTVATLTGFTSFESILIGMIITMSSTAIIGKYLIDHGLSNSLEMKIAIPMLLIEDFVGVIALALLFSYGASGSVSTIVLNGLFFIIVALFVISTFSKQLMNLIQRFNYEKHIALYALGFAFALAVLADYFYLAPALGAFLAGFLLSEIEPSEKIRHELETFQEFFIAFFFIGIGLTFVPTDINAMIIGLMLLGVYFVGNMISYVIIGELVGLKSSFSMRLANIMIPIGEFGLIMAGAATVLNLPHQAEIVNITVFLTIITTFIMPYLISLTPSMHSFLRNRIPIRSRSILSSAGAKMKKVMGPVFTSAVVQNQIMKSLRKIGISIFAICGVVYLLLFALLKTETQLISGVSNLFIFMIIGLILALPSTFVIFKETTKMISYIAVASKIKGDVLDIEKGLSNIFKGILLFIPSISLFIFARFHGSIAALAFVLILFSLFMIMYGLHLAKIGFKFTNTKYSKPKTSGKLVVRLR